MQRHILIDNIAAYLGSHPYWLHLKANIKQSYRWLLLYMVSLPAEMFTNAESSDIDDQAAH